MFGCLGRLGCLVLVLLAAVAVWFTRDRWYARFFGERTDITVAWEAVTPERAEQAGDAVESLGRPNGPGFVRLSAAELAALIAARGAGGLPSSVDSVEAAVAGDRVMLRASINLDEIGALDELGPLRVLLKGRERLEATGVLELVRQGLAEFRVESAQIGQLPVPRAAIPRLLSRLRDGTLPEGVSDNGLPFEVPDYIGDVRVSRGEITVYRGVR